jgi:hypothetical protein
MNKLHEELIEGYWEAAEYGSVDDQWNACVELEKFEREAFSKGLLKEEEIVLKYVLIKD